MSNLLQVWISITIDLNLSNTLAHAHDSRKPIFHERKHIQLKNATIRMREPAKKKRNWVIPIDKNEKFIPAERWSSVSRSKRENLTLARVLMKKTLKRPLHAGEGAWANASRPTGMLHAKGSDKRCSQPPAVTGASEFHLIPPGRLYSAALRDFRCCCCCCWQATIGNPPCSFFSSFSFSDPRLI